MSVKRRDLRDGTDLDERCTLEDVALCTGATVESEKVFRCCG